MAPVTEIATLTPRPGLDVAAFFAGTAKTILAVPGARAVRWSPTHEDDGKTARLFVDWDSLADHEAFRADTAAYAPFAKSFVDACDPAAEAPLEMHHAELTPLPPVVLEGPVAEVLHAYFPAAVVKRERVASRVASFLDSLKEDDIEGKTPHNALGWVVEELEVQGEKVAALVVVLGWESVDAHKNYRETEGFKSKIGIIRGLPDLKSMAVYHVKNRVEGKSG